MVGNADLTPFITQKTPQPLWISILRYSLYEQLWLKLRNMHIMNIYIHIMQSLACNSVWHFVFKASVKQTFMLFYSINYSLYEVYNFSFKDWSRIWERCMVWWTSQRCHIISRRLYVSYYTVLYRFDRILIGLCFLHCFLFLLLKFSLN